MLEAWMHDPQGLATFASLSDGEPIPADCGRSCHRADDCWERALGRRTTRYYQCVTICLTRQRIPRSCRAFDDNTQAVPAYGPVEGAHAMRFRARCGISLPIPYLWTRWIAEDFSTRSIANDLLAPESSLPIPSTVAGKRPDPAG